MSHSIYSVLHSVLRSGESETCIGSSATKGISDTVAVAAFVGVVRSVAAHSEATALEIKWSGSCL